MYSRDKDTSCQEVVKRGAWTKACTDSINPKVPSSVSCAQARPHWAHPSYWIGICRALRAKCHFKNSFLGQERFQALGCCDMLVSARATLIIYSTVDLTHSCRIRVKAGFSSEVQVCMFFAYLSFLLLCWELGVLVTPLSHNESLFSSAGK